jgi:hypothetical protein
VINVILEHMQKYYLHDIVKQRKNLNKLKNNLTIYIYQYQL